MVNRRYVLLALIALLIVGGVLSTPYFVHRANEQNTELSDGFWPHLMSHVKPGMDHPDVEKILGPGIYCLFKVKGADGQESLVKQVPPNAKLLNAVVHYSEPKNPKQTFISYQATFSAKGKLIAVNQYETQ